MVLQAGNASTSSAGTINMGGSLQGSFLGTKSGAAGNASNPFGVARPKVSSPKWLQFAHLSLEGVRIWKRRTLVNLSAGTQDMAFNNLACTLVGMSAMGSEGSAAAEVTVKTFCECCGPTITMQPIVRGCGWCNCVEFTLFHTCYVILSAGSAGAPQSKRLKPDTQPADPVRAH